MAGKTQEPRKGTFPPALILGCRVWVGSFGYPQHGPVDGPKQDIAGPQGGEIIATEKPYSTFDFLLYTVRWDNGQISKHYEKELFSIGRFKDRQAFEAAFKLRSIVKMKVGPRGGFRSVSFRVRYDGDLIDAETSQREISTSVIEPAAARDGKRIVKVKDRG